ncbi:MAG TPA: tyrosine-type recombinase/integrase, partial [Anaerolineae bacterium]|nr:tyrosine-type recombinase/integrase [Anaerolineae bacterium]
AMSPRYLQALATRLAKRAGIEKRVHPHTLRHTYATEEVKAGTPLHQVQKDLGHAHLATTAVYLHVFDKERQERARNRPPMGLLNGLGRAAAGKTDPTNRKPEATSEPGALESPLRTGQITDADGRILDPGRTGKPGIRTPDEG